MAYLWNASTIVRNSNRILNFLKTALEIQGLPWNKGTQIMY